MISCPLTGVGDLWKCGGGSGGGGVAAGLQWLLLLDVPLHQPRWAAVVEVLGQLKQIHYRHFLNICQGLDNEESNVLISISFNLDETSIFKTLTHIIILSLSVKCIYQYIS